MEAEFGYLHYTTATVDPLATTGAFPELNGNRLPNPLGGDTSRFTGLLNLFYDLPITYAGITPYVGGGVGYFHGSATDAVFLTGAGSPFTQHGSDGDNAGLLGEIGAAYALRARLSLVPAYRYEYFFGRAVHGANILKLGARYAF